MFMSLTASALTLVLTAVFVIVAQCVMFFILKAEYRKAGEAGFAAAVHERTVFDVLKAVKQDLHLLKVFRAALDGQARAEALVHIIDPALDVRKVTEGVATLYFESRQRVIVDRYRIPKHEQPLIPVAELDALGSINFAIHAFEKQVKAQHEAELLVAESRRERIRAGIGTKQHMHASAREVWAGLTTEQKQELTEVGNPGEQEALINLFTDNRVEEEFLWVILRSQNPDTLGRKFWDKRVKDGTYRGAYVTV
jgi:hypothetical protein